MSWSTSRWTSRDPRGDLISLFKMRFKVTFDAKSGRHVTFRFAKRGVRGENAYTPVFSSQSSCCYTTGVKRIPM